MLQYLFLLAALMVLSPLASAAPLIKKMNVCPGTTVTLQKNVRTEKERVCVKAVNMSNQPVAGEYWNLYFGLPQSLGKKSEPTCFTLEVGSNELRAGAFPGTARLYVLIDDPVLNARDTDDMALAMITFDPIKLNARGEPYDPCSSRCSQEAEPEKDAGSWKGMRCGWTCDGLNQGIWHRVCNGMYFDGKTGKPRPLP